jgi:thiosulfate reductase cytochrome b subunit
MSGEKIYLYPVYIRLWHLMNAILCLILIITGISMQFSNPKYPLIRFDLAVSVHNIVGILMAVSYLLFIIGNIFTGNGRYYRIPRKGFVKELMMQFSYYTRGIFLKEKAPFQINKERKFNPLQLFTYVWTMYFFVPVIIISGISMMYPDIFIPSKFLGISALHLTDLIHVVAGFAISLFMFIHVYFCTIGITPLSTFKSMINGFHETHD